MKNLLYLSIVGILMLSCKDDDDTTPTPTMPTAGLGGGSEISAYVRYNQTLYPAAKIYVTFGVDSVSSPDTITYDLLKVCGTSGHGLGHSHISGLHQGKYFLYAVAFDTLTSTLISGEESIELESETDHEEINITLE